MAPAPRLSGYDYILAGAYFITILTHKRHPYFGDIIDGQMCLNHAGQIVDQELKYFHVKHPDFHITHWVVMPDHIHLILMISESEKPSKKRSVSTIVSQIKGSITKRLIQPFPIWQRSFHDHIIRDESELRKIWLYIEQNPFQLTLNHP